MKANEQYGQFTSPAEVRLVRTLPGPIERIWEYLTDPEKRSRWFAGGPMEQRQGGKMTLKFHHVKISPHETPPEAMKEVHDPGISMDGVVTRWEPPRVLAYTFGDTGESEVTFELTPQGNTVQLVLTHRATGTDLPYIHGYASGWHTHLAQLIAELEGTARPPFWSMHARLKEDYTRLLAEVKSS
jgi:uncharacterized protein YndB with AHSA1/START domain